MSDGHYSEEKRKRETEERERKEVEGGEILESVSGRPLCIQTNLGHDEYVNMLFNVYSSESLKK
jgi:hypothetical protein